MKCCCCCYPAAHAHLYLFEWNGVCLQKVRGDGDGPKLKTSLRFHIIHYTHKRRKSVENVRIHKFTSFVNTKWVALAAQDENQSVVLYSMRLYLCVCADNDAKANIYI